MTRWIRTGLTIMVLAALSGSVYQALIAEEDDSKAATEEHTVRVWLRNKDRLLDTHPDVLGILPSPATGEIIIETDRPDAVPKTIEGVPVKVKVITKLPPPPGVILLHPDGTLEGRIERRPDLSACPQGFEEHKRYRWRFCQRPGAPVPFPMQLMATPIAGVPYEEAEAILQRNVEWMMKLPGVIRVGLGKDGIRVMTSHPELLPSSVEGVPVIIDAPLTPGESSHTLNSAVTPFHGAVLMRDSQDPPSFYGTLGGVTLVEGKPWGITVAHLIRTCSSTSIPCPTCDYPGNCQDPTPDPLNSCPHYAGQTIVHPPQGASATIGRATRWTRLFDQGTSSDAAAIFLDNDTTEGNASHPVDRKLHVYSDTGPFKGTEATMVEPPDGMLLVSGMGTGYGHLNPGTIIATNTNVSIPTTSTNNCWYPGYNGARYVVDQLEYITQVAILGGASGSLTLNATGDVIGLHAWGYFDNTVNPPAPLPQGGGTKIARVRQVLGYDVFYGEQTANDNSFGTFRPSQGRWYLDNGNGQWQSTTPGEWQINYGTTGDRALSGSWNGGERCVGVYRPSQGRFYLDNNCDGVTDTTITMGLAEDIPIAGDWNNDGKTDVGLWRSSTKTFYLDFNGNKIWDGCAVDKCFTYGFSTDKPVAGNWVGSPGNAAKTGVYRPSEGKWYLEKDNNGWQTGQEIVVGPFGLPDDKLVTGNWTGVGTKDKIGVFHTTGGGIVPPATWVLDNGDGAFTSYQREQRLGPFGLAEDQPVAWRKTVWKGN